MTHADLTTTNLHVAPYTVADASARTTYEATLTAAKRGMFVQQLDDNTLWYCTAAGTLAQIVAGTGGGGVTNTVKTVGSGKDYATIQAAFNYYKGKIVYNNGTAGCRIDVDAGTYDEHLLLNDVICAGSGALEMRGDTRALAGLCYVSGTPGNRQARANGGAGTVTLSASSNDLVVAMSGSNPDFAAAGIIAGDKVRLCNNALSIAEYTVTGTSGNHISFASLGAIGDTGTWACLLPNRRIVATSNGFVVRVMVGGLKLSGFYISTPDAVNVDNIGILIDTGFPAMVSLSNLAIRANQAGIYVVGGGNNLNTYEDSGYVTGGFSNGPSIMQAATGIYARYGATISMGYPVLVECPQGIVATDRSFIYAPYAVVSRSSDIGVVADQLSMVNVEGGAAAVVECDTGYWANGMSRIVAASTNANNSGNNTNYSPATSDVADNVGSYITWS